MFYPNILYAVECYGCGRLSALKKLQVVQNKALKALFGFPKLYSSIVLYKELGIMDVTTRHQYRAALLILCLLKENGSKLNIYSTVKSSLQLTSHKYSTRDKQLFNLKFNRQTHTSGLTFKYQLNWNILPTSIRNLTSITSFKKELILHFCPL